MRDEHGIQALDELDYAGIFDGIKHLLAGPTRLQHAFLTQARQVLRQGRLRYAKMLLQLANVSLTLREVAQNQQTIRIRKEL